MAFLKCRVFYCFLLFSYCHSSETNKATTNSKISTYTLTFFLLNEHNFMLLVGIFNVKIASGLKAIFGDFI